MNVPRIELTTPSETRAHSTHAPRDKRENARLERDLSRGYYVNVKQVMLAFAVEFVIIGLILTSRYLFAAENVNVAAAHANASQYRLFLMLTFPIALAMVELARVPLAIAVRVQNSWNMKLVAVLGVMGAVVVTSFNLSYIGHATFDPRLDEANAKNSESAALDAQQTSLRERIKEAENTLQGKIKEAENTLQGRRDDLTTIDQRYKSLIDQITNSKQGTNCTPIPTEAGPPQMRCTTVNPGLIALQKQLAVVKPERERATSTVQQAEAELKKIHAEADSTKANNENDLTLT